MKPITREPVTDFHKLLLIRLLRPDRFPTAMADYVSANIELDPDVEPNISLDRLMEALSCGMGGVLVLLPTDNNSQRLTKMLTTTPPLECIKQIAQAQSIECACLAVGCGNDMEILKAIEKAERDDHWVLIENTHLMNEKMLKEVKQLLARIAKFKSQYTHLLLPIRIFHVNYFINFFLLQIRKNPRSFVFG